MDVERMGAVVIMIKGKKKTQRMISSGKKREEEIGGYNNEKWPRLLSRPSG